MRNITANQPSQPTMMRLSTVLVASSLFALPAGLLAQTTNVVSASGAQVQSGTGGAPAPTPQQRAAIAAAAAKMMVTKGPQPKLELNPQQAQEASATKGGAQSSKPMPVDPGTELVTLFQGEARTIAIGNVTRVAVGNGKVVTASVLDGREVLLLAEQQGDTSLFIWSGKNLRKYRVRVAANDPSDQLNSARAMLKNINGIQIDRVGDQIVISGTVSKADLTRINAVQGNLKGVVNLAREELVANSKMVLFKVQYIEMRRNALEKLGIDWQTNINGPAAAVTADVISNRLFRYQGQQVDPTFTQGQGASQPLSISAQPWRAYLGLATSISSRINLALNSGDATVLAAPEIAARSGGNADFLAGGQVPIPVSSAFGTSVTFQPYGIKLKVKPLVDENNLIQAEVETEVSQIDQAVTVGGIPGFLTRNTKSDILVKSGQTIVMSGLISQEMQDSANKFPWLGELPVLGNFFKSTDFRNGRSDLVIFLTPTVIDAQSTQNQQRIDKAKDMREKFDTFLQKKGIVE